MVVIICSVEIVSMIFAGFVWPNGSCIINQQVDTINVIGNHNKKTHQIKIDYIFI